MKTKHFTADQIVALLVLLKENAMNKSGKQFAGSLLFLMTPLHAHDLSQAEQHDWLDRNWEIRGEWTAQLFDEERHYIYVNLDTVRLYGEAEAGDE